MNLNCEIIAVGDEVLTGDIVNTNARKSQPGWKMPVCGYAGRL